MPDPSFFLEQSDVSRVKTDIVAKYFLAWARIMIGTQKRTRRGNRIGYLDLFSGPGRYEDGALSTPLRILEVATQDSDLRERLVTVFNDRDEKSLNTLKESIARAQGIETLRYPPDIWHKEVDSQMADRLAAMQTIPLLAFIDPWGYKGLSAELVNAVLKDWGCDCIFFFNYARINAGIDNPSVERHMRALFGDQLLLQLRQELKGQTPGFREVRIREALNEALQRYGRRFIRFFSFENQSGTRVSHHLVFVSKDVKGYEVMSDVMAGCSSECPQGVPSFRYGAQEGPQLRINELERPLDELKDRLMVEFTGQSLTVRGLFERHSPGERYLLKNYKEALKDLAADGVIEVSRPGKKIRNNTMPDDVIVHFPAASTEAPEASRSTQARRAAVPPLSASARPTA